MYYGKLLKAEVQISTEDPEFIITAEVAATDFEISRGLSGIPYLNENEGMLFILEEPQSFWMAGMLIPIDIIWMNRAHEVIALLKNARPCTENKPCPSLFPDGEFNYVLEVKAGTIKKHKIELGQIIPFKIL